MVFLIKFTWNQRAEPQGGGSWAVPWSGTCSRCFSCRTTPTLTEIFTDINTLDVQGVQEKTFFSESFKFCLSPLAGDQLFLIEKKHHNSSWRKHFHYSYLMVASNNSAITACKDRNVEAFLRTFFYNLIDSAVVNVVLYVLFF